MKLARTIARMNGTDANGTVHTTYVTGAVRVIAALALSAFAVSTFSPTAQAAEIRGGKLLMTGAGSTLINPLFSKWFYEYNKLNPKVEVNYQSIGSGGGIRQLQKRTIDFAATDVAMTEKE
ncbi:MAG: extracellular solute-binding protein, partial [Bdellovibrionales bacterium]|nr:extracellular solute-binding protein [Bdellovibrionales bacterium]